MLQERICNTLRIAFFALTGAARAVNRNADCYYPDIGLYSGKTEAGCTVQLAIPSSC